MKRFEINTQAKTRNEQLCNYGDVRISVITPYLIRVEKANEFVDDPTQKVWYRDFQKVEYTLREKGNTVTITTEKNVTFYVNLVSARVTKVVLAQGGVVSGFKKGNLKGTARTLDQRNGAIKLMDGVISKNGVGVMDDSKSLILKDTHIIPRPKCRDYYYFAYGDNYRECMKDFYSLTGRVPLVPKYCLGNWWSRYKAYTQDEYIDLMQTFIDRKIPITVATIDMDWHYVDVVAKFGKEAAPIPTDNFLDKFIYSVFVPSGWTGYTWNSELFPDYKAFLAWLKSHNYHVTLNLHPSHGVRFFEQQYEEMCAALNMNPKEKKPVPFDLSNGKFITSYFDILHHPYEDEGVDFWWLDWQQGRNSNIKGLDPLWALNHYHYIDNARGGKRPLVLSRFAGEGSHRYPLGFSGDAFMTWASLAFQPYFTATASNIGYTWWSHDIGGHCFGKKDDELYLRWLQFGVFSPINRLHSTANEFMGKEPWTCSTAVDNISRQFLRLRHKLIPYIYSMNYRCHTEGIALCEPMYYEDKKPMAYNVPNQYRFGSELIVAPITEKRNAKTLLAGTKVWLPQGRYTDIFTSSIYDGGTYTMYRDLESIPVLAKAGAIIPMYLHDEENDLSLEQEHELLVYKGNNSFTLYEDDGESTAYTEGAFATTEMSVSVKDKVLRFTIAKPHDEKGILPKQRKWLVSFRDVTSATVKVNGKEVTASTSKGYVEVAVETQGEELVIEISGATVLKNAPLKDSIVNLVSRYQLKNMYKGMKFNKLVKDPMCKLSLKKSLKGPIEELQRKVY